MAVVKKIALTSSSFIGIYQIYSIYNYGKFFNKVMEIRFNGGMKNSQQLFELDKLVRNIGIYPFSLVSSIYYGTNQINFGLNNYYIPKIYLSCDRKFFNEVAKYYKEFGPKEE